MNLLYDILVKKHTSKDLLHAAEKRIMKLADQNSIRIEQRQKRMNKMQKIERLLDNGPLDMTVSHRRRILLL